VVAQVTVTTAVESGAPSDIGGEMKWNVGASTGIIAAVQCGKLVNHVTDEALG
jgi:hypothetical protein